MHVEQAADLHRGEALLRQIEPELDRPVGQHRQDRRRRAGEVAGVADDVVDAAGRRRRDDALGQPPPRLVERGLRLLDLVLRGLDRFRPRRQLGDGQIGLRLTDHRRRHVERGLGLVVIGLCRDPALEQIGKPRENALGLLLLRLRRNERRLEHGDLLRPPADLQIGQLRLCLGQRCVGLRHRDRRVAVFQCDDRLAGFDVVAAPYRYGLDAGHLDRRQQHIFALDITDGERGWSATAGKQRSDQGDRTDEAHRFAPLRAARIAARLSLATLITAAASLWPTVFQPMRRITASRPMRK